MVATRGKSKTRTWCEETADGFGCDLKKVGKVWQVIQRSTKKVAYTNLSLDKVKEFLLKQIMKYMGKRMRITPSKTKRRE